MFEAETDGFLVRVVPRYMPEASNPGAERYVWAYAVSIENRSEEAAQLITRYWRITDEAGDVREVHGPGVVGEQPVIAPGHTYRYESACPLTTPSGVMVGAYDMVRLSDQTPFTIAVPAFALESPFDTRLAN